MPIKLEGPLEMENERFKLTLENGNLSIRLETKGCPAITSHSSLGRLADEVRKIKNELDALVDQARREDRSKRGREKQ